VSAPSISRPRARSLVVNLSAEDWIALAFHSYLLVRVAFAPESAERSLAMIAGFVLLGVTLGSITLTRSELLAPGPLRALVYRVGIFAPIPASYFQLGVLLPALQPELLDLQLLALDEALLGVTPSVWLNRFNTVRVVEWVSFFYGSYFPLMAAMFLPALFFGRGRRLRELMLSSMLVGVFGHIGYTLVPGAGPYATLTFAEPLHGGFFWAQVQATVASGGGHARHLPVAAHGLPDRLRPARLRLAPHAPAPLDLARGRLLRGEHGVRDDVPALALVRRCARGAVSRLHRPTRGGQGDAP
jgi:hypothetical protein